MTDKKEAPKAGGNRPGAEQWKYKNSIPDFSHELEVLRELGYTDFHYTGGSKPGNIPYKPQIKSFTVNGEPLRRIWPRIRQELFDLLIFSGNFREAIKQKALADYMAAHGLTTPRPTTETIETAADGLPIIQGEILPAGEKRRLKYYGGATDFQRTQDYLIFSCPFCGKNHIHGGEGVQSPAHLVSHCRVYDGCYYVRFAEREQ